MALDWDKLANSPFLVGAVGAAITSLHFTPGKSWAERIANVLAGAAVAGFLSPALVEWLHLTQPSYASAAAFLCGLLGMSVMAALLEFASSQAMRETLASWLTKKP